MRSILFIVVLATTVVACASQNPPAPSVVAATPLVASQPPAAVTPTATPTAKPKPTPTPAPTATPVAACLATQLQAKVTGWSGAMGHQIADVTLTNTSGQTCTVRGTPEVELVAAHGAILIDSQSGGPGGLPHVTPGAPTFPLAHGKSIKTMVQTANYCGSAPALPTTIAFVMPASGGRLVAAPGPGGSVPSCLRSPGSLGSISMNGWQK